MRGITVVPVMLLLACAPDLMDEDETGSIAHELSADTTIIHNFKGDVRYVKVNPNEVKLFISSAALTANNPKSGFANSNHFKDSCGPTAAYNVFKWYGIVELEGQSCFWLYEAENPSIPPTWVCRDRITPWTLGDKMKTNTWTLFTITMPGTRTDNFRSVFKPYLERYKPAQDVYQYRYEEGTAAVQYNNIWATLAQGHPVVVNYKTGSTRGHFAVIVGIEKAGVANDINDDKVIMANPRKEDLGDAISFSTFRQLWRRDYADFGTLQLFGERRYTRINLWDSTQPAPPPPPGGNGGALTPPTHLN